MSTLIEQINTLVQNNQILSTVAGGSLIVWLVSNIKTIFSHIVNGITALISFSVVNTYEDTRNTASGFMTEAQRFFNKFIARTKVVWERAQNLDLSNPNDIHYDNEETLAKRGKTNVESLTYGFSIRIVFGKIVFVWRRIEKNQKITVTTTMRVFFASKKNFMARMQKEIDDYLMADALESMRSDYIKVFNGETCCGEKQKRAMDTIFTNNNEHYELLNSIKSFLDNKEKYVRLAYPYTYSALLYGEPGCGKTSTILAVATALHKDITYINLGKITLERLISHLNNAGGRRLIVFEDIDALTNGIGDNREKEAENENESTKDGKLRSFCSSLLGISLSDLLNITDGLLASEGTICLFTTNHIERLDPAFLRSGRMNKLVKFTKLNHETAAKMIEANLGYHVPTHHFKDDAINPADLQETILNITLGRETKQDLAQKFLVGETA